MTDKFKKNIKWDLLFGAVARIMGKDLFLAKNEEAVWLLCEYVRRNLPRICMLVKSDDLNDKLFSKYHIFTRMIALLFRDGSQGNKDAIDTSRKLFRIMYRREYNWVKRMHTIDVKAMMEFADIDDKKGDDVSDVDIVFRILCMARILDAELCEEYDWMSFFSYMDQVYDEENHEYTVSMQDFLSDRADTRKELVMSDDKPDDTEIHDVLMKIGDLINRFYSDLEKTENGIVTLASVMREDSAAPYLSAATYIVMAGYTPTSELLQAVAAIMGFVRSFRMGDLKSRMIYAQMMDIMGDAAPKELQTAVSSIIKQENKDKDADNAQITTLLAENLSLQSRLMDAKNKSVTFRSEMMDLREKEKVNSEEAAALQRREEERDREIEALRRALLQPEEIERSDTDMISLLSSKKICIIGGHENWLNKIRALFPGWVFIGTAGLQTKDASSLANMDCVCLFTDHLDHKTYKVVMQIVRPIGVKLGYITSVNIHRSLIQFCDAIGI